MNVVVYGLGAVALAFLGYEGYTHWVKKPDAGATRAQLPSKGGGDLTFTPNPSGGNSAPPSLLTPAPSPTQPANPPAIDLGADGPLSLKNADGSLVPGAGAFDLAYRKALAWDSDPASLDRYVSIAKQNGWNTVAGMLATKRDGLIAHPQPYPYIQSDYPIYLLHSPDGTQTYTILWDGNLTDAALGVAKAQLANELDMGNLANLNMQYAANGYPMAAQHFSDKYLAQVAVRQNINAPLPLLFKDTTTGNIMSTHISPVNPVKLFTAIAAGKRMGGGSMTRAGTTLGPRGYRATSR